MADKHPYLSGVGAIHQTISQLRKSFPNEITSDTLKKLGIAKNNESAIISILKFINVLDEKGSKTKQGAKTFVIHIDNEFQEEFSNLVREAYLHLFELYKEDAWTLDADKLIAFFRQADQTSFNVGKYQTGTFQALATVAGKLDASVTKASKVKTNKTIKTAGIDKGKQKKPDITKPNRGGLQTQGNPDFGLTVRVEINLPANADKETYDSIFKSIRENLIEGKSLI